METIYTENDLAEKGLQTLGHEDSVEDYQRVVVTEDAVYGTDANVSVDYVEGVLDEEVEGMVAYDSDSDHTSITANRANSELDALMAQVGNPFRVLDGQLQAVEGQSTDTVQEGEVSLDNSSTAGRNATIERAVENYEKERGL
jgi:hypothetical protein